jgi:hypothetical protein
MGRTVTDNCYANALPNVLPVGALATTPRSQAYCHVAPPLWNGGGQVKLFTIYPLPWGGVQVSATYQNLPGIPITAQNVFVNGQIAPSLGRNLAAGPAGSAPIDLVPNNSIFEPRLNQVDLRFSKIVRFGSSRLTGNFDIYNLTNSSTILTERNTYGSTWQQPTLILAARLFKFGVVYTF